MGSTKTRVIIVGAGIIGAAAAYELSARGAQVQVIDAGSGRATDASFGWANASFYQSPTYFALRVAGIDAYRALQQRLEVPVRWCGSIAWENAGAELDTQFETLQGAGYACEMLSRAEIAQREPDLGTVPDRAIHFPDEAAIEPSEIARVLLAASGAQVLRCVAVTGFVTSDSKVNGVQTPVGDFEADHVLLCTGTGTSALLEPLGINVPLLHRPALVLHTQPVDLQLRNILATDFGEVRQLPDGALTTPAAISHQSDASEAVQHPGAAAEISMARLRALFPKTEIKLAQMQLAYRPVPKDGFPAVGPVAPGLYAAVMHSGITLAALMGDLIAREMLEGQSADQLAPFRPGRFAG